MPQNEIEAMTSRVTIADTNANCTFRSLQRLGLHVHLTSCKLHSSRNSVFRMGSAPRDRPTMKVRLHTSYCEYAALKLVTPVISAGRRVRTPNWDKSIGISPKVATVV